MDIQFDLGAGETIIKKSSVEKVKMKFDGTTTLHNSDGTNQVPSASRNLLEMGNLVWDSIAIVVADNMTHREDLIVGNSLFRNKIIEIDYDQKILLDYSGIYWQSAMQHWYNDGYDRESKLYTGQLERL